MTTSLVASRGPHVVNYAWSPGHRNRIDHWVGMLCALLRNTGMDCLPKRRVRRFLRFGYGPLRQRTIHFSETPWPCNGHRALILPAPALQHASPDNEGSSASS